MAHVKRFRGIPMSKVRSYKVIRAETGVEPEVQRQQGNRKCLQKQKANKHSNFEVILYLNSNSCRQQWIFFFFF